jgi:hypothetical protein
MARFQQGYLFKTSHLNRLMATLTLSCASNQRQTAISGYSPKAKWAKAMQRRGRALAMAEPFVPASDFLPASSTAGVIGWLLLDGTIMNLFDSETGICLPASR